jgi:putative ABC transport system permease protein
MADWRRSVDERLAAHGVAPLRRQEIIDEVATYLQDRYDELVATGRGPDDARALALADLETDQFAHELAGLERRITADIPDTLIAGTRRSSRMAMLWQDLTYAFRSIRKAPAFAAVVIITLALGIGANTAIFTVVDAVMLRPYAFADTDRIMMLSERTRAGASMAVAWPTYQDWRAQNQTFERMGIYRSTSVNITGGDHPERLAAAMVAADVFTILGIQPIMGRTFLPAEDQPSAAAVTVISERLWRRRLNADPAILGQPLLLNGVPHTVVGVMPPTMRFPGRSTDVWLPLGPAIATLPQSRGTHPALFVVGKLKAGVTFESAVADMDTIARRIEQQYPESNKDVAVAMIPYYEQVVQNVRPTLLVLVGAVGFVLLIACANLANLMLARGERQQRDIAVRRALGADRWRIVQQLLTESIVLAVLGGVVGIALAYWAVTVFVGTRPATVPRMDLAAIDARVLTFAAAVSMATGVLFGLVPAIRTSSPDVMSGLKQGGRGTAGLSSTLLRGSLVVAQVALALMLLVGAGLMLRSFARLAAVDPGFDPRNVVTTRLLLPAAKYSDLATWIAFHDALAERVSAIPGVTAAGLNSALPLEGGGAEAGVVVEGRPIPPPGPPTTPSLFQASSPDYLRTMGVPLIKGRFFTAHDNASAPAVTIVDETLVAALFPNEEPLGKRIGFEFQGTRDNPTIRWREIVGVVGNVRHYGLVSGPQYVQLYTPVAQLPIYFTPRRPSMALVVRTAAATDTLVASIRREVAALDKDIPLYAVEMMSRYVAQQTEQPRLSVALLLGMGAIALTLALVGIYGVVSYTVAQRTPEIGVRLALGATHAQVLRLIVGQASVLVALGVVVGLAGALALSSVVKRLLYQVSERDPATLAIITVVLVIVGVVASAVPARRAARIDPIIALRE